MAIANLRAPVRELRIRGTGAANSAANNLVSLALATTLTNLSLVGFANIFASDGTDAQSRTAGFAADAVNKAGTVTATGTITGATNVAASSGTLTVTSTPSVSGTTVTLQLTPVSSLTPTTLTISIICWLLQINGGNVTFL